MIKNLIFDVGNVLLEYRWVEALADTGLDMETAKKVFNEMFLNPLWVEADAGTKQQDELIVEFGKMFPSYAGNIKEFIMHGERMHLPRPEVWEKIHRLKEKGYAIYLLSNYSKFLFDIHTKGASFMDDIDGKVVSYEIHQVKPDRGIYETLLNRFSLNPEECIFFDDRKENTETAKELGIKTCTIESRDHINKVLSDLIEEKDHSL